MSQKAPTKIDDKINFKFEEIVDEFTSAQQSSNSANNGCHNVSDADDDTADRMVRFLCLTGRLKTLPRRGWILNNRGIQNPESIAGHMYRMAIMKFLFDFHDDDNNDGDSTGSKTTKLDANKVMKLSLVHDMAECIVGDITPMDGIDADEKHRNELEVMEKLASLLPSKQSKHLLDLYREYDAHQSAEALLVKEFDRFDICLQAFQYEQYEYHNHEKRIVRFDRFFEIADENINHPLLRKMLERIFIERDRFWHEQIMSNVNNHKAANEAIIAAKNDNLPVDLFAAIYNNNVNNSHNDDGNDEQQTIN
nr:5'-deoxynucleotidase HDDC2-like [Dermatophagoides farinae]